MAAPVPTSLSLTTEKKGSPFICLMPCCLTGTFNATVIVSNQGGFEEEGLCAKIGAAFKRLCYCCRSKEKESAAPEAKYRKTRQEVRRRVANSLNIYLPGETPPPREQLEEEAESILTGVDPQWNENTEAGVPLSSDAFQSIGTERRRCAQEKVGRAADTLRSGGGHARQSIRGFFTEERERPQATPVKDLLQGLVLFVHERKESMHREETVRTAVKNELQGYGYHFPDLYIDMIIDQVMILQPGTKVVATTISYFESVFQVAAEEAG